MTKHGFTLIEVSVVLAIAGLVMIAGLVLLPKLWHEKQRLETHKQLLVAKEALLTYATNYGALPGHDDPDKLLLPTGTLKLRQKDAFDQPLRYIVNSKLLLNTAPAADKTLPCSTLKDFFKNGTIAGFPRLWQYGMLQEAGAGMAVAAVLISPGTNGALDKYFAAEGETVVGDNNTAVLTVNFVQAPVSESFDDLVEYLTITELLNILPGCRQ